MPEEFQVTQIISQVRVRHNHAAPNPSPFKTQLPDHVSLLYKPQLQPLTESFPLSQYSRSNQHAVAYGLPVHSNGTGFRNYADLDIHSRNCPSGNTVGFNYFERVCQPASGSGQDNSVAVADSIICFGHNSSSICQSSAEKAMLLERPRFPG